MKTACKRLPALVLLLNTVQAAGGELLGKMSDETAPLAAQPEPAAGNHERRIIYRVICSPEGEALPECSQPPVNDTFEAAPPKPAEPETVETPAADTPREQVEQADLGDRTSNAVEAVAPKKAAVHKKRAKKSAKKSAPKTAKPAKRKQR